MIGIRDKKHIKILCRIIVYICAYLCVIGHLADEAYADTQNQIVRVGYYENEVFQEGAGEGEVKSGYSYEYYRKLSEYTGWEYEYVYGEFSELYQMLLDGKIDLLAGLAKRDDRIGIIGYPNAKMGNESYYLVKYDDDISISADPATLNGCRIGVLDSAMVGALNSFLDENNVSAEVITYPDYPHLFEAFDAHKVSVLAAESDGAHGRDHYEVLCVFGASDYYLCVNIERPDLLSELNSAQSMLASEEPNYLSSLSAKYYSVSVTARAFSQAEREWMNEHQKINIGYLENYLPYSDKDSTGNVTGIIKDMVPEIMDVLGIPDIEVNYKGYQKYDDMIADMAGGVIDVAFPVGGGLYYSEENGIYQSNAVVSSPTALIFQGEYGSATTARFAVNENNRMHYYYVRTNYPDAEIVFYPSIDDCLAAVLSGKVGATTLNGLRANEILKNRKYKNLIIRQSNHNDDCCFGVKIGNEGLLKLLNRGINVLGADYAQNISYRYTESLYSYSFWDMLLDNMAAVGSILLIIVALIVFLLVRDIRRTRKEVEEKEKARQELEEKNSELADSQKALSDALRVAENANRAKTVFLNNMSHDIRTPMNAIIGFTALAESNIDNKQQVKDYLGKISTSSGHLLLLINDVLDMSRIESGKVTIEETDVHLPDVINELSTIIQSDVDSKQMELMVDAADVIHEDIITDKLRLKQVLLNILSNAVKFTPEGGKISFGVMEKPAAAENVSDFEFKIKDNGIGMSEEFLKTIFEPFTREKTSTVSGIQGTGLGMAIAKNIVDMMDGTIKVRSAEGEGSEFTVTIPCRLGSGPAKNGPVSEPDDTNAGPAPAADNESAPDFTGKRVLLAEDNEMNQILAENILTSVGFEVDIAGDGTEAVEKVASKEAGYYDIILMDIQMPQMDGYEATNRIRALADEKKAGIPIVAVTANAFKEDRQSALGAGMNGHLSKPYDIPEIMKTLKELLKGKE
jgi:signal transduction histidine kinase/CheY-like chemotaxis protein